MEKALLHREVPAPEEERDDLAGVTMLHGAKVVAVTPRMMEVEADMEAKQEVTVESSRTFRTCWQLSR